MWARGLIDENHYPDTLTLKPIKDVGKGLDRRKSLSSLVTRNATGKPRFAFRRQKRVSRLKQPFLSHLTVPVGYEGVCSKNICQFFVLATVCYVLLGY
ncbi:hypothetical protein SUGI_0548590 [Cryptomeria japonica]|nr:hypothetical protein SUGI_0548590 [Cryptomeria japonica]